MKTTKDFRDGHLWYSVINRPPSSSFTCVQRVSCCFSLLLCTMLTSIMFYGIPADPSDQVMDLGMLYLAADATLRKKYFKKKLFLFLISLFCFVFCRPVWIHLAAVYDWSSELLNYVSSKHPHCQYLQKHSSLEGILLSAQIKADESQPGGENLPDWFLADSYQHECRCYCRCYH